MWRASSSSSSTRVIPSCARSTRLLSAKSAAPSDVSRKRVKKNYSDLPTSYKLADGTVAAALPPLGDIATTPIVRRSERTDCVFEKFAEPGHEVERVPKVAAEPIVADEAVGESSTAPRKRRPRKALALDDSDAVAQTSISTARPPTLLAVQINENRERFPGCILLTRVGQFYESYFDQAPEIAQLLNIKLTSRPWGGAGRRVHMCGFPLMHLDRHLKTLVQTHARFVALCEEFPPSIPGEEFVRKVVRVITPGTLIDESFVNTYENNYLLAISPSGGGEETGVGLAWIDVSTGEFFSQPTTLENLRDDISRIGPREVIVVKDADGDVNKDVLDALSEESGILITSVEPTVPSSSSSPLASISTSPPDDLEPIPNSSSEDPSLPLTYTGPEQTAIRLLTTTLSSRLLENMPDLPLPTRQRTTARMQIDSHTIHALEIREAMREGGTKGSLLSTIKRTVTSGGTRLLTRWLCSPSTSLPEISARQALVALFHALPHLRADLTQLLLPRDGADVSRIVQRLMIGFRRSGNGNGGGGDAEDLIAVKDAIHKWAVIRKRVEEEGRHAAWLRREAELSSDDGSGSSSLEQSQSQSQVREDWTKLEALMDRMKSLHELADRISSSIDEDALRALRATNALPLDSDPDAVFGLNRPTSAESDEVDGDGDVIGSRTDKRQPVFTVRPEFSLQLSRFHEYLKEANVERDMLERRLREEFQASSITLRHSAQHGFYVHVGKIRRDDGLISQSPDVISIAKSKSTHTYLHSEWLSLGRRTLELESRILREERAAFEQLREEVLRHASQLRLNARIVDELDVALGFASLAADMKFVRPVLDDSTSYDVVDGRHPTVELGLLQAGRTFTPNSVSLTPSQRLHFITGPNMSGKSSLLRQTALIAILAQVGSFVPASSSSLGIVDKVFSRVGAKDDLYRDRSTFMVEMLETADILRRATERSLVIMDEVGRGTTSKDGAAIAFATVVHLYRENHCRALFATHFHEVADLLGYSETDGEGRSATFDGIGFFCTDVDELENGEFAYSHRLRPGVNRNSHGLKVAKMSGMPPAVLEIAAGALEWMDGGREMAMVGDREGLNQLGARLAGVK